ncbi:MAG: 2-isopropylmalate synthase [Candidatus Bathyarchaeota archaeon]|nr:2-isopropylmalate synthase [Candidatus Bathyarchaeota archaeon]
MFDLEKVSSPNLYKEVFPYDGLPRMEFEEKLVPMNLPEEIWVTDTTFRDGQQAREPYTVEQMINLFDLMHRLGGEDGVIKFTEFFLYTKRDREAVKRCLDRGYEFPKVTAWIRANKGDLELVKEVDVEEAGILSSLSDYHIFYKFGWDREKTVNNHLSIAEACLKKEIIPRCHVEDATRADFQGVVIPFVQRLMLLSEEYGLPTKVRLCDTLGLGLPYPNAKLPRSIPKMIHAVTSEGDLPSEWLEFHGHNDFHQAVGISTSAWLYGCCGNNGTLLGIGERAGNTPVEGLLFQLLQLKRDTTVDTMVLKEIAEYYREIGYLIPEFQPLVGGNFNVTRAGVHSDGMIKNPEIYTSYNMGEILGLPPKSVVGRYSGASGIAWKVNELLNIEKKNWYGKKHPAILLILETTGNQYNEGRVTAFSDREILELINKFLPHHREKGSTPKVSSLAVEKIEIVEAE